MEFQGYLLPMLVTEQAFRALTVLPNAYTSTRLEAPRLTSARFPLVRTADALSNTIEVD